MTTETNSRAPAHDPRGVGGPNQRRSGYATRDLTSGSIPRNLWFLWFLAWPQTVEGAMRVLAVANSVSLRSGNAPDDGRVRFLGCASERQGKHT